MELALKCYEALNPIAFTVNANGEVVEINNLQQLQNAFKNHKKELESFYTSPSAKVFINHFEQKINHPQPLLSCFLATPVFKLLLPKMQWFKPQKEWDDSFYFTQNATKLNCKARVTHNTQSLYFLETKITAEVSEPYDYSEVITGIPINNIQNVFNGQLQFVYYTDKISKQLTHAQTKSTITNPDGGITEHQVTLKKLEL